LHSFFSHVLRRHPDQATRLSRILALLSLATWLGPLRRFVLAHPLGR
jgi:hypothetical protein